MTPVLPHRVPGLAVPEALGAVAGIVVIVAASSCAPSSSTPRTAPTWAASSSVLLYGSPALTGPAAVARVVCGIPDLSGEEIQASLTSGGEVLSVTVTPSTVRVATGPGRSFSGPGVIRFDPRAGAELDAGNLRAGPAVPGRDPQSGGGFVTRVRGTLVCARRQASPGAITLSGRTTDGSLSGPVGQLTVTACSAAILEARGTVRVGGRRHLMTLTIVNGAAGRGRSLEVELATDGPVPSEHLFAAAEPARASATSPSARASSASPPAATVYRLDDRLDERFPSAGDSSPAPGRAATVRLVGYLTCS